MMTTPDRTTAKIVEHNGEYLLDLGLELCESLGWQVGDTMQWSQQTDGSWILTNLTKNNHI